MIHSIGALRRRRAGYARYADLIVAQIDAIQAEDLERFRSLAEERDAVARQIDEAPEQEADGTEEDRVDPDEIDRLMGEVRLLLERCREHDARLRDQITRMRDEAREALGRLERRRPHVEAYVRAQDAASRVDVRL